MIEALDLLFLGTFKGENAARKCNKKLTANLLKVKRLDINEMLLRDGDTLLMDEGFIFYVFGYEHPDNRLLSFLYPWE